jgi:hypothetical protein
LILLFAVFVLLSIFAKFTVRAEIPDFYNYFETLRGELLGFYNSELISHTGIILGLIVGIASIGPVLWNLVIHKKVICKLIGRFSFGAIIAGICYFVGRFFYWSAMNTILIGATESKMGINANYSDPTSLLFELGEYTVSTTEIGDSTTSAIAVFFSFDNLIFWIVLLALIVCFTLLSVSKYNPFKTSESSEQTNNQEKLKKSNQKVAEQ